MVVNPKTTKRLLDLRQRLVQILPGVCSAVLFVSIVLIPLVILPFGENFLLDSKVLLFFVIGIVVFAIWAATAFAKKTVQFTFSPFLPPLLLLLISTLFSGFFNAVYPINQFVGF